MEYKTYCTQFNNPLDEGSLYSGPYIDASSEEQAELKAMALSEWMRVTLNIDIHLKIDGELVEIIYV